MQDTIINNAPEGKRIIPRITIAAHCDSDQAEQLLRAIAQDRRMSRTTFEVFAGGIDGAIEQYGSHPTPNLLVVETNLTGEELFSKLARLADVCEAFTKVVVMGRTNDVIMYREMIRAGISEYVVLPAEPNLVVNVVEELYASQDAAPVGRTIGFIGAKGGSGSSTMSHNVASVISKSLKQDVLLIDLDLAYGTAGLDFNQDPPQGLADALYAYDKVDAVMLDRLMAKIGNNLNLLAAPALLDRTYDLNEHSFEQVLELAQEHLPVVILDIPHVWTHWMRRILTTIDQVVITAEPDLASLRNVKNIAEMLRSLRPGDNEPLLVLNKQGMGKRPEIPAQEFVKAVGLNLAGEIAFDPQTFGTASNNGQMISEVSASHKANATFHSLSEQVTGRSPRQGRVRASRGLKLPSLFKKK